MRLLLGRVSLGFFRLTSHGERDCYLFDVDAVVWCWVAPRGMRSGGSSICTLAANGGRFFFIRVLAREVQIFASAGLTLRGRVTDVAGARFGRSLARVAHFCRPEKTSQGEGQRVSEAVPESVRWREGQSVPCMSSSPCEGTCELARVDR